MTHKAQLMANHFLLRFHIPSKQGYQLGASHTQTTTVQCLNNFIGLKMASLKLYSLEISYPWAFRVNQNCI